MRSANHDPKPCASQHSKCCCAQAAGPLALGQSLCGAPLDRVLFQHSVRVRQLHPALWRALAGMQTHRIWRATCAALPLAFGCAPAWGQQPTPRWQLPLAFGCAPAWGQRPTPRWQFASARPAAVLCCLLHWLYPILDQFHCHYPQLFGSASARLRAAAPQSFDCALSGQQASWRSIALPSHALPRC